MQAPKTIHEIMAEKRAKKSGKPVTRSKAPSQASSSHHSKASSFAPVNFTPVPPGDDEDKFPPQRSGVNTPKSFAEFMTERTGREKARKSQSGSVRSGGTAVTSQSVLDNIEELKAQNEKTAKELAEIKELLKKIALKNE
jgi:hypothetical protein